MSANPVVLDEDTYTDAISFIIERDFFPNLSKIKAQHNYLEAQSGGTLIDLQKAGKTLHDLNSSKPKEQKRDTSKALNFYVEDEPALENRVNLNLSLDQFQTLYTSEDNASFTDLLEKANIKKKQENKWFYDRESKQLRITDKPNEESPIRLIEAANDRAPTGWKYKALNALMYYPLGKSESWVNESEGRGAKKSIEYNNTHISTATTLYDIKNNSNALAPSDRAAAQGAVTPWTQLNGLNDDTSSTAGSRTPGIRGYNLVDATPTLSPGRAGTPMMTWGSIEGTPLLISGSQTPGPQFSLPQVSKREELGMKLSEKASKAYRKKTNERQRSTGGTPRVGAGLMSPAAQHLLRKSTPSRTQSAFGDALRSSYGGGSTGSGSVFRRTATGGGGGGATPTTPLFRAGATPSAIKKTVITKKK